MASEPRMTSEPRCGYHRDNAALIRKVFEVIAHDINK
jgi:hypothetical protein